MSEKCIWCGGEVNPNVIQGMYYCPHCDEDLTDKDVLPMTVFDHITESVEALAEKLVYSEWIETFGKTLLMWNSTVLSPSKHFKSRPEAIVATVAEMKKEWKEDDSV
jgi:ABC-type molybdate transport system ATPase subunit